MMITDHELTYFYCDRCGCGLGYAPKYSQDFSAIPRPHNALAYILEGEGDFISADRADRVRTGDLVLTPMGSTYRQVWDTSQSFQHISVRFIFRMPPANFAGRRLFVQRLSGFSDLREDFEYILAKQNDSDAYYGVMSRFYAILGRVSPDFAGCELPPPDPIISRAVSYIEANCRRAMTIDELSALCNLSRSHLFSRFKQVTGCTPIEYKHRAMVQRAQRLLIDEPSLSIEEVSERTGFESAAYFRRVFRSVTNLSPREYKRIERGML